MASTLAYPSESRPLQLLHYFTGWQGLKRHSEDKAP